MTNEQLRDFIQETKKPYQGIPGSSYKTNHTLDLLEVMEHMVDKIERLEAEQAATNFFTAFLPFGIFGRKV